MVIAQWLLCVLFFMSAQGVSGSFFDGSIYGDPLGWIKSLTEAAPGLKSFAESTKVVEQAFSRDTNEFRIQRISALEGRLKELRDEKVSAVKQIDNRRKLVVVAASRARSHEIQSDGILHEEAIKRLLLLYEERLQAINGILGVWATLPGILEGHLASLQHQSDDIVYHGVDLLNTSIYRIEEYNYVDNQIEEIDDQIKKTFLSRKAVMSERGSLLDRVAFLRKELEQKGRELESFSIRRSSDESTSGNSGDMGINLSRSERERLLREECDLVRDKILHSELKIRKIDLEQATIEDEITGLRILAGRFNALLTKVKRNLVIDLDDLARVRAEKTTQEGILGAEKERIRGMIHEKTFERERVREHHESTKSNILNLRAAGKDVTHEGMVVQAREWLDKNVIKALDAQIALLSLDDDFAHAEAAIKSFQFTVVDIRYHFSAEDQKISGWIEEIANGKRLLENDLAKYHAQKNDAISSITHMQEELDRLKKKQIELGDGRTTVFLGHDESLKNTIHYILEAKEAVRQQITHTQKFVTRAGELLRMNHRLLKQYVSILGELEAKRVSVDIWRRSTRGLSLGMFLHAGEEVQLFCRDFLVKVYDFFDFASLFRKFSLGLLLGFFLCAGMYLVGYVFVRAIVVIARRRLQLFISYQKGTFVFWYLNVVLLFFDAFLRQFPVSFLLLFSYLHFKLKISYYGLLVPIYTSFFAAIFCLAAMGMMMYLTSDFLSELRVLNARLSYFFFSERNQRRILMLLNILFYATVIAFPFRNALMVFGARYEYLPTVIFALYSLSVTIALAFFFEKDDFVNLISGRTPFWLSIRESIDVYFYPVFSFGLLLCVLANPYVGYVRLAGYLAFFMPVSLAAIWCASFLYGSFRRHVLWVFIEERDDELAERFEYAKVYYGFFVTITFFALVFLMVGVLSKIWGLHYSFSHLWYLISEEWVVPFGPTGKLGLFECLTLYTFITGGYLASTCINRFVLTKVFEVFGAEPGAQNTFSRIFHIIFLVLAVAFGCTFIGLSFVVVPLLSLILLVGGVGAKDLVADFVAGLLILLERQIEIGHYITAENMRGTVHKISARSTIIRTQQNYFVVIPNRTLISHPIINWGAGRFSVGFEMTISVGFENDPEMIISILRKVLNANALVLRVPSPSVRLESFTQSGADYFVRAFVSIRKVREQWEVAGEIRVAVYKLFREKGIVFPYPRLVMYNQQTQYDDPANFFKFKFDQAPDEPQR